MSTSPGAILGLHDVLSWASLAEMRRHSEFLARGHNGEVEHGSAPVPCVDIVDTDVRACVASDRDILIVDDESDLRTMLRLLLQDEGYRVSEAADGVTGLASLRARPHPTIVLLDYKMPRMNGEELLTAVMGDPQLANRHAFIFLTANLPSFSSALRQLLAATAVPVIQKPFDLSHLLEAIEQATARLQTARPSTSP